jgi:formylmethanofuran dehydrogenase subunit D
MHPDDMKELGVASGGNVRVRTETGAAVFLCKEGNIPRGLLFVPYGPPTCRLMGGGTDGTGMPTSKGWDVEVEPTDDPVEAV